MKPGICLRIVEWEFSDGSLSSLCFCIYLKVSIIESLYICISSSEWIRNDPSSNPRHRFLLNSRSCCTSNPIRKILRADRI